MGSFSFSGMALSGTVKKRQPIDGKEVGLDPVHFGSHRRIRFPALADCIPQSPFLRGRLQLPPTADHDTAHHWHVAVLPANRRLAGRDLDVNAMSPPGGPAPVGHAQLSEPCGLREFCDLLEETAG
jgi:hypothetical protein